MLFGGFLKNFNKYWASHYVLSDLICVDESIYKCYCLGRNWIIMGLPMCVVIDNKPINGCEIQNSRDSRSQVMMQLKLVKSEADEDRYMEKIRADVSHQRKSVNLLHVTKVIIDLMKTWRDTWRTV